MIIKDQKCIHGFNQTLKTKQGNDEHEFSGEAGEKARYEL